MKKSLIAFSIVAAVMMIFTVFSGAMAVAPTVTQNNDASDGISAISYENNSTNFYPGELIGIPAHYAIENYSVVNLETFKNFTDVFSQINITFNGSSISTYVILVSSSGQDLESVLGTILTFSPGNIGFSAAETDIFVKNLSSLVSYNLSYLETTQFSSNLSMVQYLNAMKEVMGKLAVSEMYREISLSLLQNEKQYLTSLPGHYIRSIDLPTASIRFQQTDASYYGGSVNLYANSTADAGFYGIYNHGNFSIYAYSRGLGNYIQESGYASFGLGNAYAGYQFVFMPYTIAYYSTKVVAGIWGGYYQVVQGGDGSDYVGWGFTGTGEVDIFVQTNTFQGGGPFTVGLNASLAEPPFPGNQPTYDYGTLG